jgi:hypothetical protein
MTTVLCRISFHILLESRWFGTKMIMYGYLTKKLMFWGT